LKDENVSANNKFKKTFGLISIDSHFEFKISRQTLRKTEQEFEAQKIEDEY
jgi:hypothetical protein